MSEVPQANKSKATPQLPVNRQLDNELARRAREYKQYEKDQ
jgi:hypothetical protein